MTNERRAELEKAFDLVSNKKNWKNPINKTLRRYSEKQIADIYEAVIFFTGSVPTITTLSAKRIRVQAIGYYNAIGA